MRIHITHLTSPHLPPQLTSLYLNSKCCDWLQPWWTGSVHSAWPSLPRLQPITALSVQTKR